MNANHIAIFGFVSGVFTLVLPGYRHDLKTRWPVIAVGLACCGIYAFLAGVWPLGFVLIALTAAEFRRRPGTRRPRFISEKRSMAMEQESRIHRMFGPA